MKLPERGNTNCSAREGEPKDALATSAYGWSLFLKKHSAFVGFPVTLNGNEPTRSALWTKNESEVSDEDATAFYRFVGGGSAESAPPSLHFAADAPAHGAVFALRGRAF